MTRIDSHESLRQPLSTIINTGQTRTRVVESPSRVTRSLTALINSTVMENFSTFKVDNSARESMRVDESFRPNESESLNSYQFSSSFHPKQAKNVFSNLCMSVYFFMSNTFFKRDNLHFCMDAFHNSTIYKHLTRMIEGPLALSDKPINFLNLQKKRTNLVMLQSYFFTKS